MDQLELKVNDRLTLKLFDDELHVYASGQEIPINDFVDDMVKIIKADFQKYIKIFQRHGKEFWIYDRAWLNLEKGEILPAWFTLIKISKSPEFIKKLVVPMIYRGNLQSLLFLYTEHYINLLDILNMEEKMKDLLATQLLTGIEFNYKWIFNISFDAVMSLSYGTRVKEKKKVELDDHLNLRTHIGEENYIKFIDNLADKLLKNFDPRYFHYRSDEITKFFSSFGQSALNGLQQIYKNSSGELKTIAEKSLLKMKTTNKSFSLELDPQVTLNRLKDLDLKEIKTLIPKDTGRIIVENIVEELKMDRRRGNWDNYYDLGVWFFERLGKDPEISYEKGVENLLHENDFEKVEVLLDMNVFKFLSPEESESIFKSVDIENIMSLLWILEKKDVPYRGYLSERKNYWNQVIYLSYLEAVSNFFAKVKGKLTESQKNLILEKIEAKPADFSRNIVKLHLLESPSAEDLISFLKSPMYTGAISEGYQFFNPFFDTLVVNTDLIYDTLAQIFMESNIDINAIRGLFNSTLLYRIDKLNPELLPSFFSQELFIALIRVAELEGQDYFSTKWSYDIVKGIEYYYKKLYKQNPSLSKAILEELFISQDVEGLTFLINTDIMTGLKQEDFNDIIKNPRFNFFESLGRVIHDENFETRSYEYPLHQLFDGFKGDKKEIVKNEALSKLKDDKFYEMSLIVNTGIINHFSEEELNKLPDDLKINLIKNILIAHSYPTDDEDQFDYIREYTYFCEKLDQNKFLKALFEIYKTESDVILSSVLHLEYDDAKYYYEKFEKRDIIELFTNYNSKLPSNILKILQSQNFSLKQDVIYFLTHCYVNVDKDIVRSLFINIKDEALKNQIKKIFLNYSSFFLHYKSATELVFDVLSLLEDKSNPLGCVSVEGKEFFVHEHLVLKNSIKDLTEIRGLENLKNLKTLSVLNYASKNKITEIKGINHLSHLESLNLNSNNIIKIESIDQLSQLKDLDLSLNHIEKIEGIDNLSNLESLNLRFNRITKIEGLSKLKNLKILKLFNNNITSIENLDGLANLEELYMGNNPFTEIQGLETLLKLEKLSFYKSKLSKIKDLHCLKNLKELSICKSDLVEISGLENLSNLIELDLSGNNISEIKGLESLVNLEKLDLRVNKIKEIKGLETLKKLIYLNLDDNEITEIKGLDNLVNLEELGLNSNKIEEEKGLENLRKLKIKRLYFNPLAKD